MYYYVFISTYYVFAFISMKLHFERIEIDNLEENHIDMHWFFFPINA